MDILSCRAVRRMIVDFCECVYRQDFNSIYKYWNVIEQEMMKVFPENERLRLMLDEIRVCMKQCNFLRNNLLNVLDRITIDRKLCDKI